MSGDTSTREGFLWPNMSFRPPRGQDRASMPEESTLWPEVQRSWKCPDGQGMRFGTERQVRCWKPRTTDREPAKGTGLVTMGTRWVGWRLSGPVPPRPAGAQQACPLWACHLVALGLDSSSSWSSFQVRKEIVELRNWISSHATLFLLPQSFIHSTFIDCTLCVK